MEKFYYFVPEDGVVKGPQGLKILKAMSDANEISADCQICKEGTEDWCLLTTVLDSETDSLPDVRQDQEPPIEASTPPPLKSESVPLPDHEFAPNPLANNDDYYVQNRAKESEGPFVFSQIETMWRNGKINNGTLFRTERNQTWKKVELMDLGNPKAENLNAPIFLVQFPNGEVSPPKPYVEILADYADRQDIHELFFGALLQSLGSIPQYF